MDTMETQKNYPVQKFLDSLGQQFKAFDLKRTDAKSSQTMFIIDRITKQNEIKKEREQLKQKVTKINKMISTHEYDFEILCNELVKSGVISVSFFLDVREYDQQGH